MPLMVSVRMSNRARTSSYEDELLALMHHHQFVREQRVAPVHQNTVASTVIGAAERLAEVTRAFRWNQ
jgi:hypothetical protein